MNYIGVQHGSTGYAVDPPLRELLLVDRVAVIGLDRHLHYERNSLGGKVWRIEAFEALQDTGLVFEPEHLGLFEGDVQAYEQADRDWAAVNERLQASESGNCDEADADRIFELQMELAAYEVRGTCLAFRGDGYGAVPLHPSANLTTASERRTPVMELVLDRLPVVSRETPVQAIVEFRENPDNIGAMAGLRTWIAEVAKGELEPNEVEDKLDYLLHQYRKALQLNELKFKMGNLESIVVTGAEVLENLVRFRWSDLAKKLFSVRKREIDLLQAEMGCPGVEVSYIVKASRAFGDDG